MENLHVLLVLAALSGFHVQTIRAEGYMDVKLRVFSHSCREDASTSKCDPYFYFCVSRPKKSNSFKSSACEYNYKKTSHFQNDGHIDFQTISDKRGAPAPWVFKFTNILDPQIMFSVKVVDDDYFGSDDHMVTLRNNMTLTVAAKEAMAKYEYFELKRGSYTFRYAIRVYCSPYYHGSKCLTYCKARNDDEGHYTCEDLTGVKLCLKGWKGDNCHMDVNECELGFCATGTCQNLPGNYECTCPPLFTGKNCSINQDPCSEVDCLNGGSCLLKNTPSGLSHTCLCVDGWTGSLCENKFDPCTSHPCLNGGSCSLQDTSSALLSHTCLCVEGWTGSLCENKFDPCSSYPCLNGGSCVKSANNSNFTCFCPASHRGEFCHIKTTTTTTTTTTSTTTTATTTTPSPTTTTTTTTSTTTPTTTSTTTSTTPPPPPLPTTTDGIQAAGGVGRSKSESETKAAKFEMWHGLVLGIFALIILLVIVVVFVKKRKNRKLSYVTDSLPPPSTTIIVYDQQNGGHLAFENTMYVEANRNNTEVERTQQQNIPPVPSRPPSEELFYPTKPEVRPAEYEVPSVGAGGAEGVTYDNGCLTKEKPMDKEVTKIKASGVTQLGRAPTERAENNPYADFKSLTTKRKSTEGLEGTTDIIPVPDQVSDQDDEFVDDDEDHYQELDEVAMIADLPPTLRVDGTHESRPDSVPPPRVESMIPQELPPVPPFRKSPSESRNASPTFEYDDDEDDDTINPYTSVNKSRHSIETIPVRGDYDVPAEARSSIVSDTSGYDVPSGIGPRSGHYSVNGNGIYDNPRHSNASSTLPEFNTFTPSTPFTSEYNVPSSLPVNKETKRPVGLIVTSDPWANDPFTQSPSSNTVTDTSANGLNNDGHHVLSVDGIDFVNVVDDYEDDDESDDNEPEDIKHLKNEVKSNLDFILLDKQTSDISTA